MLQVWHVRALGQRVCSGSTAAAAVATAAPGGAAEGGNTADNAPCGSTARTTIGSISPIRGGSAILASQTTHTAFSTGRTYDASGPRRTLAAHARKCIRAGNPILPGCMGSPSNHNLNHNPSPQSSPSPSPFPNPSPSLQPSRACEREGGRDGHHLWYLATTVTNLWHGPYTLQPAALAVHWWAEGTVSHWTRELRALGRTTVLHHEATIAQALAEHITTMAAHGPWFGSWCVTQE